MLNLFGIGNKKISNTGVLGEDLAAEYLKKKGYKIKARNFKNDTGRRMGEIDIIAEKEGQIVFVEVKTRETSSGAHVLPEENINFSKLRRLNRIAHYYIKKNKLWDRPFRFDAVSVVIDVANDEKHIKHIESIFI